jgi:maltooligosyltrehalose synthase
MALAPRLGLKLLEGQAMPLVPAPSWRDTNLILPHALTHRRWRNICTGEEIAGNRAVMLGAVLKDFPVGLLMSTG